MLFTARSSPAVAGSEIRSGAWIQDLTLTQANTSSARHRHRRCWLDRLGEEEEGDGRRLPSLAL